MKDECEDQKTREQSPRLTVIGIPLVDGLLLKEKTESGYEVTVVVPCTVQILVVEIAL
jgi:hypothetical protein